MEVSICKPALQDTMKAHKMTEKDITTKANLILPSMHDTLAEKVTMNMLIVSVEWQIGMGIEETQLIDIFDVINNQDDCLNCFVKLSIGPVQHDVCTLPFSDNPHQPTIRK